MLGTFLLHTFWIDASAQQPLVRVVVHAHHEQLTIKAFDAEKGCMVLTTLGYLGNHFFKFKSEKLRNNNEYAQAFPSSHITEHLRNAMSQLRSCNKDYFTGNKTSEFIVQGSCIALAKHTDHDIDDLFSNQSDKSISMEKPQ